MIPQILVGATIIGFGYYCFKQFKEVGRVSEVKPEPEPVIEKIVEPGPVVEPVPNSPNWRYFKKRTEPLYFAYNAVTCSLIITSSMDNKVCISLYENNACNINHHLTTFIRENAAGNPFHYETISQTDFINQFNLASDKFDFSK